MLDKSSLEKLIPRGLLASRWAVDGDELVVDAVGAGDDAACPECGVVTGQVHSRYRRTFQDLPAHGRRMVIQVGARRFRCREAACLRKTFCEPFEVVVDGRYARRTARSEGLVLQIALAMGGRAGERLTARLCIGCHLGLASRQPGGHPARRDHSPACLLSLRAHGRRL